MDTTRTNGHGCQFSRTSNQNMDQFEETVVNPNISLNNFEVKIREHEDNCAQKQTVPKNMATKNDSKSHKALLLLALLSAILLYQITVIL